MINTWFIGDTHFGHANILKYESAVRPFQTLEEMHEVMIERWNSCVKHNDNVYHLGDFCFGSNNIRIAGLLNGKKKLILGNHDTYGVSQYLPYFNSVYGVFDWNRCILTHVPIHSSSLGSRWFLNVHGHLHSKVVMSNEIVAPDKEYPMNWMMVPDKNYLNVSCEQNNLTPIHADITRDRIKELE